MKTPKEYIKNLNKGILTDEMICDVLYSYSKRAKNYRDNNRELRKLTRNRYFYSFRFDPYKTIAENEFRKNVLYERKSGILEKIEERFLKCIHKQDKHATRRIYEWESDYSKYEDSDDVVWANCYLDRETMEEVYFIDVLKKKKEYLYFKFYDMGEHSFHTPIEEHEALEYEEKGLKIEEIDDLVTFGEDTGRLLSLQFCDKVYKFLYPEKKVYKISQPVCVDTWGKGEGRFYSDEEIREYREKKEIEKKQREEETIRRREERKQKTIEERAKKKVADAEHKAVLREMLKEDGESDWRKIRNVIIDRQPNDSIFEKIFAKLGDVQKQEILEGFWKDELEGIDDSEYKEKIYPVLDGCPHKEKDIVLSVIAYKIAGDACLYCKWKDCSFDEFASRKREESFVSMLNAMISYNDGKMKDEDKIKFIRTDKHGLCFCGVPLIGNISDRFMYDKIDRYVPKAFKYLGKKEFNSLTSGQIFTIEKRLQNRCSVGQKKFKEEAELLKKRCSV